MNRRGNDNLGIKVFLQQGGKFRPVLLIRTENAYAANSPDRADSFHLCQCLLPCSDNSQVIGILLRQAPSRDPGCCRSPQLSQIESIDDGSYGAILCVKQDEQR